MKNQKTVLITGANKGIGLEVAKQLGNLGFFVVLTARDAGRGQEAWKQLERQGTKGMFLQMDVGSVSSIQQAAQELLGQVNHIDILINNAGILLDEQHHLMDTPPDIALQTLQVNALGALWVTQTFAPLLHKGSRVIMISSGAGGYCEGISTWAPLYSISKTTLNAITRQLHEVLSGKDIIVCAMCPGWVRTDMGDSGASRPVEKGAETAVWLTTDAPDSVAGKFLRDKKEISW